MMKLLVFWLATCSLLTSVGCSSIPPKNLTMQNNEITEATINGQTVRLLIDPGSDTTMISPALKTKLSLANLSLEEASMTDKTVWIPTVTLDLIKWGNRQSSLSPVLVVDFKATGLVKYQNVDGVLGADFLNQVQVASAR